MKIVLFKSLHTSELLEIAKYMGVDITIYNFGQSHPWHEDKGSTTNTLFKVDESELHSCSLLSTKDFGPVINQSVSDEEIQAADFDFKKDELRYDFKFIKYLESNANLFPSLTLEEVEEDKIFRIVYDGDYGIEYPEIMNLSEWHIFKNGVKETAFQSNI